MSIKLANGENIVKSFDYAGVSKLGIGNSAGTTKKLIVTNKRIIHESVTTGMGTDCVSSQEIPVKSAKYVNTYYGMKSHATLLIWGILLAFFAIALMIAGGSDEDMAEVMMPFAIIILIVAAVFFLLYFFVKDYIVTCTILTDGFVAPVMGVSSRAGSTLTNGARGILRRTDNAATINVKVKVKKENAKAMAEELGATLLDAIEGNHDDETVADTNL